MKPIDCGTMVSRTDYSIMYVLFLCTKRVKPRTSVYSSYNSIYVLIPVDVGCIKSINLD